jgi:hypothetical protein
MYFLMLIYIYIIILNYIFHDLAFYFIFNFFEFLSIINIQYKIFNKDRIAKAYFLKFKSDPYH